MGCDKDNYCCGTTTVFIKVSAFILFVTFLFHVIGFASPFWSLRGGSNEGLWEFCNLDICQSTFSRADLQNQGWFLTVQILQIVALITGIVGITLVLIIMFALMCAQNKSIRIAAVFFVFFTGVLLLISMVIYGVRGAIFFRTFALGFAFAFVTVAGIGYLIVGCLLSIDIEMLIHSMNEDEDDSDRDHKVEAGDNPAADVGDDLTPKVTDAAPEP